MNYNEKIIEELKKKLFSFPLKKFRFNEKEIKLQGNCFFSHTNKYKDICTQNIIKCFQSENHGDINIWIATYQEIEKIESRFNEYYFKLTDLFYNAKYDIKTGFKQLQDDLN